MMKQSNFEKKLNKVLTEEEHYVLNILLLSYLTDDSDFRDIAELCFMFDSYDNFKKFIKYYGGRTLKVPTQNELRIALKHLLLFQYVKIDGKDFEESYTKLNLSSFGISKDKAKGVLDKFYDYLKEDGNSLIRGRKKNKLL